MIAFQNGDKKIPSPTYLTKANGYKVTRTEGLLFVVIFFSNSLVFDLKFL